jgi:AraC-like DNA-binding protein
VREALYCLKRTMHLHNEALRLEIEEAHDVVVLREQLLTRIGGSMRQSVDLAIGVLYRVTREFLGDAWSPTAVCFTHQAPRDMAPYRKAFGTSVQFNSVLNGLTCRSRDLDRAMPGADPQLLHTIQKYLRAGETSQPTLAGRATNIILDLLPTGRCTSDLVALYLGMHRRTLHRRLEAEGTTFLALLDGLRIEAAKRHLPNPQQTLADLATMLGFSDLSAFSRWFAGKFGMPPSRWRRQEPALRDRKDALLPSNRPNP